MEVKAVVFRFSLFVLNPRIFLELVSLLRKHGIFFRAPMEFRNLCFDDEFLIVDIEGLKYIKELSGSLETCRDVIVVNKVEEIYSNVLSRVLGDCTTPISIGIDLGKRIAYAILAGGRLLVCDYVDRVEEVKEVIERLSAAGQQIILVGIGAEYLNELPAEVIEIMENDRIAATYIIDEERTNKALVPMLAGEESKNLSKDLRAAVAIAMKVYEKYMLGRSRRR